MPLRPAYLRRNGKSQATAAAAPRRGGSRARGAKGAPARAQQQFLPLLQRKFEFEVRSAFKVALSLSLSLNPSANGPIF